nr:MAG TPA: Single stranded DNA binding protein [Caudoviricetes sp.]
MEEKQIKNEEEKQELAVSGFGSLQTNSKTQRRTFTTLDITDVKTLYNLDNTECDFKINDCVGQSIRVVDVVVKEFEKELEEPILDKETGEVVQDKERKMVTILIDDTNKTYVTASKMFTIQMKRFIEQFGVNVIKNGLEIKIVNKKVKDSNNKCLGFELI